MTKQMADDAFLSLNIIIIHQTSCVPPYCLSRTLNRGPNCTCSRSLFTRPWALPKYATLYIDQGAFWTKLQFELIYQKLCAKEDVTHQSVSYRHTALCYTALGC